MRSLFSPNGGFLYASLLELLRHEEQPNNIIVEAVINELVKETIREQANTKPYSQDELLRDALSLVARNIDDVLRRTGTKFNLEPYAKACEAKLKYVSREIAALSEPAHREGFAEIQFLQKTTHGVTYQITPLNIGKQFKGLYGFTVDGYFFDRDALKSRYNFEAENFPFGISQDGIHFTVDFNCVLVNLQNFSKSQWIQAKETMVEIMHTSIPLKADATGSRE